MYRVYQVYLNCVLSFSLNDIPEIYRGVFFSRSQTNESVEETEAGDDVFDSYHSNTGIYILKFTTLGKSFSRRQFKICCYYYYNYSYILSFAISCKLSPYRPSNTGIYTYVHFKA